MNCNCIETGDGVNFSLRLTDKGQWMGNVKLACNKEAVIAGKWHDGSSIQTFVYCCPSHAEYFAQLDEVVPFRPWFEKIAYLKRAA